MFELGINMSQHPIGGNSDVFAVKIKIIQIDRVRHLHISS